MADCVFCRIVSKKVNSRIVYEDDEALAFEDVNPQAPVHALIVPKRHITGLNEIDHTDANLMGHLLYVARLVAEQKKIHLSGYRTVVNTNAQAGQSVFHLHMHVLGGRYMSWPPG